MTDRPQQEESVWQYAKNVSINLCGCCCCKTSEETEVILKVDTNNNQHKAFGAVTYETVYSWGLCFDNLMATKTGQMHFKEFLTGEFSDENILFWTACEALKSEKKVGRFVEKVHIIMEDFISMYSPKEISIDGQLKKDLNAASKQPTEDMFKVAQDQIYNLMARDSYPRFVSSPYFKSLKDGFGVAEEAIGESAC